MSDFVLFTDSCCDIPQSILDTWNVKCIQLSFCYDHQSVEYRNCDVTADEFYKKLQEYGFAKTSAINAYTYETTFEEELKEGRDLLYIGFSSGLSSSSVTAQSVAADLKEKYPERKIKAIDSLCGCGGQGLLVHLADEKRRSGASIEETAEYVVSMRQHIDHWFTLDTLTYLRRGGRISASAAAIRSSTFSTTTTAFFLFLEPFGLGMMIHPFCILCVSLYSLWAVMSMIQPRRRRASKAGSGTFNG